MNNLFGERWSASSSPGGRGRACTHNTRWHDARRTVVTSIAGSMPWNMTEQSRSSSPAPANPFNTTSGDVWKTPALDLSSELQPRKTVINSHGNRASLLFGPRVAACGPRWRQAAGDSPWILLQADDVGCQRIRVNSKSQCRTPRSPGNS